MIRNKTYCFTFHIQQNHRSDRCTDSSGFHILHRLASHPPADRVGIPVKKSSDVTGVLYSSFQFIHIKTTISNGIQTKFKEIRKFTYQESETNIFKQTRDNTFIQADMLFSMT